MLAIQLPALVRVEKKWMKPILHLQNVTRKFGGLTALDDISFEIRPGEIVGLIGPNGAGKTTLVNLVTAVYGVTRRKHPFRRATDRWFEIPRDLPPGDCADLSDRSAFSQDDGL